jgi:hypothetical protein
VQFATYFKRRISVNLQSILYNDLVCSKKPDFAERVRAPTAKRVQGQSHHCITTDRTKDLKTLVPEFSSAGTKTKRHRSMNLTTLATPPSR